MNRDPDARTGGTAWIVVAHGSRAPGTVEDHLRVCDELAAAAGERVDAVTGAFLEINEPSIPDALDAAVAAGASRVVVLPYFLHAGTHTRRDLPELLDAARERHPETHFALASHLAPDPRLVEVLLARAEAADR